MPSDIALSPPGQRTFQWARPGCDPWMVVTWPPPTLADALADLRFDDIAESAELAEGLAQQVADAADRGERLKVRAYAGLLSRAVRNILTTVAELGSAS